MFGFCISGVFINEKYFYLGLRGRVEDQFNPRNRFVVYIFADSFRCS
jgi:phospholipid-transporting ATPase